MRDIEELKRIWKRRLRNWKRVKGNIHEECSFCHGKDQRGLKEARRIVE